MKSILESDINFLEEWNTPKAFCETMFSNFDNPAVYEQDEFGELRLFQEPFLSSEPLIDFEATAKYHKLDKRQENRLRKNVGDLYLMCARKIGKTLVAERLDLLCYMIHAKFVEIGFGSIDLIHLNRVLDKVKMALISHPILKLFATILKGAPNHKYFLKNNVSLESVNFNIGAKNPGCFDDKTEILTDNGWKFFEDLNYTDKVMSTELNTRNSKYCKIKKIIKEKYIGSLLKLKNSNCEFLVTSNHKFVLHENKEDYIEEIDKIKLKQFHIPCTINWKGSKQDVLKLEGIVNSKPKTLEIPMPLWVKFIAWYLSEGSLDIKSEHYRIWFAQKKPQPSIIELINDFPAKIGSYIDKEGINRYTINNKLINLHIKKYFGKVKTKRIPSYFKNLKKEYLKLFIDEYILGDGHQRTRPNKSIEKCIFTSLSKLADDLQETAIKAGYKAQLRISYGDRFGGKNYPIYYISLGNTKNCNFKKDEIEKIKYNGFVYCVETEPYNTIVVRRNGRYLISSNSQWYGQHCNRIYLEESSLETEEVYNIRIEAEAEEGAVIRSSGMCNFVAHSPAGKAFYDIENKKHVINLPEYVNKWAWDAKEKKRKLEQYGGESSIGYKVYIEGTVCSDGIAVFQMDRIANLCYLEVKKGHSPVQIKRFEINKENYPLFKSIIILERPNNVDRIFLAADIGEKTTEIVIFSELGNPEKYNYLYNITLFNTTHLERVKIFEYIIEKINANVVALDAGDGAGRALYSELEKKYGAQNLVYYDGSMKLDTDFSYDENKNIIMEKGLPVYRQEKMSEFSVQRLMSLLYGGRVRIPQDYKFHTQFSVVMSMTSGTNIKYKCVSDSGDHLFDAWRVFAISQFIKADFNTTPKIKKEISIGICDGI